MPVDLDLICKLGYDSMRRNAASDVLCDSNRGQNRQQEQEHATLKNSARTLALAVTMLLPSLYAKAETQFSIYGGAQFAAPSQVSGHDDTGAVFNFNANWLGKSFAMPPYYGLRATHWMQNQVWGVALEFTHEKVYADPATMQNTGFEILEFTDGLNILTVDVMRRFAPFHDFRPYVGAGIGVSVPNVEVRTRIGGPTTFEYQLAGPAARVLVGVEYDLSDRWSVFGEVNSTYSTNDVVLSGGGDLSTDIFTYAIGFGASMRY